MKKTVMSVVAAIALTAGAAQAATFNLVVEGGGTPQIYELTNGNLLGLYGIDNREGAVPGGGAVTVSSLGDLTDRFTPSSQSRIVNAYNGSNPINAGTAEFDVLSYDFEVADDARLFNAIWIEWTGGNLVYQNVKGGTSTMGTRVSLDGDPLSAVPVPAALPMLLAAIGGLGLMRRRKTA